MTENEFDGLIVGLRAACPVTPKMPVEFKSSLRDRLISEHDSITNRQIRRWIPAFVSVGLLALVVILGLLWSPRGAQGVSAAELLQKANKAFEAQAGEADVIYDRLQIKISRGLVSQVVVVTAELWQSTDGQQYRYLLKDSDGRLLYFSQRDGDQFWRSYHNLPTSAGVVTSIYKMTIEQYRHSKIPKPVAGQDALQAELSAGWLELDRVVAEGDGSCTDLFCLLGIAGEDWQCQAGRCTLRVDEVPVAVAELQDDERGADGNALHVVSIEYLLFDWKTVVKVDAKRFALVEIAYYDRDGLLGRVLPLERKALPAAELPANVFSSIPGDVQVTTIGKPPKDGEPQAAGADRIWIESISPEPGTALNEQTEFRGQLGYELASLPEAALQVMLWPAFDWTGGPTEGSGLITVPAGIGTVEVKFNVAPETLEPGKWVLRTYLGTFKGDRLSFLYLVDWEEYEWCVRCSETPGYQTRP